MIYLAFRNLFYRPTSTFLCVTLLAFGVGLTTLVLQLQHQLSSKLERDLVGIDVVVGAKGSPLQLVLSAIYHLDAPTGNIPVAEVQKLAKNSHVANAIPLAYGDYFGGYRILGTTSEYLELYNTKLANGRLFAESLEVVLGSAVAVNSKLGIGDTFHGQHGIAHVGEKHEDSEYRVVGVLRETGTVVDQLVLTKVESVWAVHAHPEVDMQQENSDHDHSGHDHFDREVKSKPETATLPHRQVRKRHLISPQAVLVNQKDRASDSSLITSEDKREVTAVLLKFKGRQGLFNVPRLVNESTSMQAVLPAIEINRLFSLLGVGAETLRLVAWGILWLSAVSVFLVLFNRLRDRRTELALLRCLGYQSIELFGLLVFEGVLLALVGYLSGVVIGRVGLYVIGLRTASDYHLDLSLLPLPEELGLLVISLLLGLLAALLPAIKAARIDISTTLVRG